MERTKNFEAWLGKTVFFFLCASIAMIGVGRLEIPFVDLPFRCWSVSRVTLFFWLIWRVKVWYRDKRIRLDLSPRTVSIPLFLFVGWVIASLLPNFQHTGDFRYLMFAVGHYLMVVDLFDDDRRRALLYALMAMTPGILLFRGIIADPAILNLTLASRLAYPLAHANPAGYLFSMSIPLCLALILSGGKWLRPVAVLSFLSQLSALILTFSRAAWIASCVSLTSISVAEKRLRVIVSMLGVAGLIVFGMSGELRNRLWSLTHTTEDPLVMFRADVIANAISVGIDSPFFGNGYGRGYLRAALKKKFPEFAAQGYVPHSHNLYSELIAGVGLLGVAIFIWALASAGIQLIRQIASRAHSDKERYADLGLLGSLIAFVIAALGDVPFYHHEPRIFFFTLLGLICLRLRPKTAGPDSP
jgi:O-Antigen ligase